MRIKTIFIFVALFVLVLLCYGNTLDNGFVWDDNYLIKYNPLIRAPIISAYRLTQDIANTHFNRSDYYRPLQILTYAMDYRIFGLRPLGYHLTNLLLYSFCAFLVFLVTFKICGQRKLSFIVSVLFTVFPANMSAVSYIAGRADLLYVLFGLLAVYCFLRFREESNNVFLVFTGISLILSLLSKESAVIVPFILLFLDILVCKKGEDRVKGHLLFFGILLLYITGYIYLRGNVWGLNSIRMTVSNYFISIITVMSYFLKSLIFPLQIHVRSPISRLNAVAYFAVLMTVGFMILSIFLNRDRRRQLLFLFIVFVLSMLPFGVGALKLGVIGYHWFVLAGYSFIFFLLLSLQDFVNNKISVIRFTALGIIAVVTLFYAFAVFSNNSVWSDDIELSDRVLLDPSQDSLPLRFKYTELLSRGAEKEALRLSDEDVRDNPESPEAWTLKGIMYMEAGDMLQSRISFENAIKIDPNFSPAYTSLARNLMSEKKDEEAVDVLKKAISINGKDQKAYILITPLYAKKGRNKEALIFAEKAVELNPYTYNALINLGSAYLQANFPQKGVEQYIRATKLYPEEPLAYFNLGSVFYQAGDKKEAKKWINKALKADPDNEPAKRLMQFMKTH